MVLCSGMGQPFVLKLDEVALGKSGYTGRLHVGVFPNFTTDALLGLDVINHYVNLVQTRGFSLRARSHQEDLNLADGKEKSILRKECSREEILLNNNETMSPSLLAKSHQEDQTHREVREKAVSLKERLREDKNAFTMLPSTLWKKDKWFILFKDEALIIDKLFYNDTLTFVQQ